ncbi:MAG TPA: hypothetical protein VI072_05440 [Polyangiaceae bacterium]
MMKRRALGKVLGRPLFWGGLAVVACNVMGDPPSATGQDGGAGIGGNNGGNAGSGGDASAGDGNVAGSGGTGATDTGPWWQKTISETCQSEGIPKVTDRPTIPKPDADDSIPPFYVAQTRIRFGTTKDDVPMTADNSEWRNIGFDFDETCFGSADCYVDDPAFPVNDLSCASGGSISDGRNCRDNQIGKLFWVAESSTQVRDYFGMSEHDWNCELHRGGFSIIYKISNYNGKLNDPEVRVDLYNSIGTQNSQGWACRSSDAGHPIAGTLDPEWYKKPAWVAGAGNFLIPERSVETGSPPIPGHLPHAAVNDVDAFVRNGILVAFFEDRAEVALLGTRTPVPGFRLILDQGTLAAELFKDGEQHWTLKGTLAGLVNRALMTTSFREIGFCENICGSYRNVIDYLDVNQDTIRGAGLPTTPCNALTYATAFVAKQATVHTTLDTRLPEFGVALNDPCPEPRHPAAPRQNCTCEGNPVRSVCPP